MTLQIAAEFFEAAAQCDSVESLEAELAAVLNTLGITHYAGLALVRGANGAVQPQTLFRKMDEGWVQDYYERGAFNHDAVVHRALARPGSFTFEEVETGRIGKPAQALFGIMREAMPIDAGYIVSMHDAHRFAGLIGLYSSESTIAPELKPLLTMIALYATERAKALDPSVPSLPIMPCPLSARQREMLAFAAQGKSDWDISQIVGLACSTVNEHVEKAKSALKVKTRAQAIAIAVHRGWIQL